MKAEAAKFTPGPWHAGPYRAGSNGNKLRGTLIVGPGDEARKELHIALVIDAGIALVAPHPGINAERAKSNASLIAAAPEMYDALKIARQRIEYLATLAHERHDKANVENFFPVIDAALAKAEGRS